MPRASRRFVRGLTAGFGLCAAIAVSAQSSRTRSPAWVDDLSPIGAADWNAERAAHLLERAGFGGTPEDIARLASLTPQQAVDSLVEYQRIDNSSARPFEASGV